jgi:hypothetical protein
MVQPGSWIQILLHRRCNDGNVVGELVTDTKWLFPIGQLHSAWTPRQLGIVGQLISTNSPLEITTILKQKTQLRRLLPLAVRLSCCANEEEAALKYESMKSNEGERFLTHSLFEAVERIIRQLCIDYDISLLAKIVQKACTTLTTSDGAEVLPPQRDRPTQKNTTAIIVCNAVQTWRRLFPTKFLQGIRRRCELLQIESKQCREQVMLSPQYVRCWNEDLLQCLEIQCQYWLTEFIPQFGALINSLETTSSKFPRGLCLLVQEYLLCGNDPVQIYAQPQRTGATKFDILFCRKRLEEIAAHKLDVEFLWHCPNATYNKSTGNISTNSNDGNSIITRNTTSNINNNTLSCPPTCQCSNVAPTSSQESEEDNSSSWLCHVHHLQYFLTQTSLSGGGSNNASSLLCRQHVQLVYLPHLNYILTECTSCTK